MDDRNIKALTRPECRVLLTGVPVGRLIHAAAGTPIVCPLPFVMYDEAELVLAPSKKLRPALAPLVDSVVAFHVSTIDGPNPWRGWSVTVIGILSRWQDPLNRPVDGYLTISGEVVTGFEVVSCNSAESPCSETGRRCPPVSTGSVGQTPCARRDWSPPARSRAPWRNDIRRAGRCSTGKHRKPDGHWTTSSVGYGSLPGTTGLDRGSGTTRAARRLIAWRRQQARSAGTPPTEVRHLAPAHAHCRKAPIKRWEMRHSPLSSAKAPNAPVSTPSPTP
ncbi:pyridoxamine 5'-phosphate oxidase family protein [Kibdelosporangium aridum]|uniref:pyridoxamine 5'-phosphate oxidase family protein n=1 Tax=Kibdelosporangium aridum TaxID=2030 RepID=UPI002682339B